MMNPKWVQIAEYVSDYSDEEEGLKGYEWNAKGLQDNLYYEVEQNGTLVPYRIFQKPQSDMTFDLSSYSTDAIDASVFELPTDSGDCEQSCGFSNVCAAL